MTKKFFRLPKKRILIGLIIGLIILSGGAGVAYYLYLQNPQRQIETNEKNKAIEVERKKLEETAFKGDRDVAAQYMEKLQGGETDAAYDVYKVAAQKTDTDEAKIGIYEQAVAAASQANKPDQAIRYAILLSELSNTHRASANVAYLYRQSKDTVNEKKYLQQALDQLETSSKDTPEYVEFKTYYQGLLSQAGVQ
jgi:hypothetical protein